ncbi:MAG: DUF177 domain-containing protein [Burkholderiales bacterium]|nr:DUF177 domain-containing protein [Burkholderiales bacterium]
MAMSEAGLIDTRRAGGIDRAVEFGPAELPRLAAEALALPGGFGIRLVGVRSPRGLPGLALSVSGQVRMTCQRCMQPVDIELRSSARFELVERLAADVQDDDETWEKLEHSDRLDLRQLAEDELLLALPYAPKHDSCTPSGRLEAGEKTSPFAALAMLRSSPRR